MSDQLLGAAAVLTGAALLISTLVFVGIVVGGTRRHHFEILRENERRILRGRAHFGDDGLVEVWRDTDGLIVCIAETAGYRSLHFGPLGMQTEILNESTDVRA